MILARLGDHASAQDHLHHALDIHGLDRRRTRAIVLADLGTVRLRQDDVDGALTAWNDFLDCADTYLEDTTRATLVKQGLRAVYCL